MSHDTDEHELPGKRQRLDLVPTSALARIRRVHPHVSSGSSGSRANPLGERLRKLMLCTVCLDLPHPEDCYQCYMGHIICGDCASRLLAEAAMRFSDAQCPQCRIAINWTDLDHNLAIGQTLWELPMSCGDCQKRMEFKRMENHLKEECPKRYVPCKYQCLGCAWRGPQEKRGKHVNKCKYPHKSSDDIIRGLRKIVHKPVRILTRCHKILSAERVNYRDVRLHWPMIFRFNRDVFFYTTMIQSFEITWRLRVKLCISQNHTLYYSLKILAYPRIPVNIKYFATLPTQYVRPNQGMDLHQKAIEKKFYFFGQTSDYEILPMTSLSATYRFLSMPNMMLRLWMMLN